MAHGSIRLGLLACLSAVLLGAAAPPAAAACEDGPQDSGAVYRICMPEPGLWNGRLVVWAHGYVAFNEPVAIPEDQLLLADGTSIPDLVTSLGFAFATTSYSVNGLAVRQGLDDILDLVRIFNRPARPPALKVYLAGASEGGLITTLGVERHPDIFAGGLAACGPIGSFPLQINHFGDFRALFDYFFPGLLPGDPTHIPPDLIEYFDFFYAAAIRPVIFAPENLSRTRQLLRTAQLPTDASNFWATAEISIYGALWYSVFSTNDAEAKLGGQPFDNTRRIYLGSNNDLRLNLRIQRTRADAAALAEMVAYYNATGRLSRPLVTLHTLKDPVVPAWHEALYIARAWSAGSLGWLLPIPVDRYGHCNFTRNEVLAAFGALVSRVENPN